jgi:hypothetical protein
LLVVTGEKNYCKKGEYQEKSVQFLYPYGNSALRCRYKNNSNIWVLGSLFMVKSFFNGDIIGEKGKL